MQILNLQLKNNLKKSSRRKVGKLIAWGNSMSMIWTFDSMENKNNVYRGEDCMKKFCESLREHTVKIINFEKKKILPLINEQQESNEKKSAFARKPWR